MIKLEYFDENDFDTLISWIESPELLLQWGGPNFTYPLDKNQLQNYISKVNTVDSDTYIFKVVDVDSEQTLGHISINKIDQKNKSARIGKVLVGNKNFRGQGIGEAMMKEILKISFGKLQLHRVDLGVFDFNTSAIRCYEKVGFVKEGLLRDVRKIDNHYWSLWNMSILDHEWLEKQK